MEKPNNLISLDVLRALAASFVLFFHHNIGGLLETATGVKEFNIINTIGAKYAVPIFFILSGYCIELSVRNASRAGKKFHLLDFYKKRFRRIYIPYLFSLFLAIALNFFSEPTIKLTTKDFLYHLFMIHGFSEQYFNTINIVFWTLTIELSFYFLYPSYFYLNKKISTTKTLIIISTVSAISTYFCSFYLPNKVAFFFPVNIFIAWCFGCALYDCFQKSEWINRSKLLLKYLLASLVPLGIVSLFRRETLEISNYNLIIIAMGIVLIIFLSFEKYFNSKYLVVRIFVLIGLSSYSLYLIHQPIINFKIYLLEFIKVPLLRNLLHLIWIPMIYVLAYAMYVYIEKPYSQSKNK